MGANGVFSKICGDGGQVWQLDYTNQIFKNIIN